MVVAVDVEVGIDQLDLAYERWMRRTNGGDLDQAVVQLAGQIIAEELDGEACAQLVDGPIALAGRGYLAEIGDTKTLYTIGGKAVIKYFEAAARDGETPSFDGLFRAIGVAFEMEAQTEEEQPEAVQPCRTQEEIDRINLASLEKANRVRSQRALAKRGLATMKITVAEILADKDEDGAVAGMKIMDLLKYLPAHHHPKRSDGKAPRLAAKILLSVKIDPDKKFGQLTNTERRRLLEHLAARDF